MNDETKNEYPKNWEEIAEKLKKKYNYCCERCGHKHDSKNGYTLTVHHLVPKKDLCEEWNLAVLCQRCHLKIQKRVNMFQDYFLPHSKWFIPHLEGFLKWYKKTEKQVRKEV
jgi:5-methylcytosine-specific restriction endonuclease McrA